MNVNASALRPYTPLVVLLVTIAAGWTVVIRPLSADQSRASAQLATLRQREMTLRRELGAFAFAPGATADRPVPRVMDVDPAVTFERRLASGNAAPDLLEQLARLASASRARNLLIETVEGETGPAKAGHYVTERDPRFALFDVPVSQLPIRVVFDTGYADLGRFLWAFRTLPTIVEIRALSVGLAQVDGDEAASTRTDIQRVSLTLHAYSRSAPAVIQASNTVSNGATR